MKLLLVNCVFGYGSTGKIICDIVKGLEGSNINPIVAFGRGTAAKNVAVRAVKLCPEWIMRLQSLVSKITGYSYDCSPFSTHALYRLIEREKPDVVNLHCVNANTVNLASTISYLKKNHIKTVLSIHAEFPYTGGCGHAYECEQWKYGCRECVQFKSPISQLPSSFFFNKTRQEWEHLKIAYEGFEDLTVTCVSPWLAIRAKQSPFYRDKDIVVIKNGLNTAVFHPRNPDRLRALHNLQDKKIILHVTPNFYFSLKGGHYVLEIARRLEIEHPDYRIIVCGYNGNGGDLPSNIIPVRYTRNQEELAEYYTLANVTLLTSKKESYSMVTAESLCCGTPVVGFKAGGPESIAIAECSIFLDYGEIDALYRELVTVVESDNLETVDIEKANQIYSLETMAECYKTLYEKIIKK